MKTLYRTTSDNIKVTIRIPENVPDRVIQEKINYIYDVLSRYGVTRTVTQTSPAEKGER